MKHIMPLLRFSFDKIINGTKRIDLRLFDEEHQKIKLNDIIEYVREDSGERLLCLVRGIVVFERFDDMIEILPTKIFGYDSKEEIKIRASRFFSFEEQMRNHVMGIIIMPLQVENVESGHGDEYLMNEYNRDEGTELKKSRVKDFSKVRQMEPEEEHWKPISQHIEHCEDEGIDEKTKAAEIMRLRESGDRGYDR